MRYHSSFQFLKDLARLASQNVFRDKPLPAARRAKLLKLSLDLQITKSIKNIYSNTDDLHCPTSCSTEFFTGV